MIAIFKTKNKQTRETSIEEFENVFKVYWEKSIKRLLETTNTGEIQFTLIDLTRLKAKIRKKVNCFNFEKLFSHNLTKYTSQKNLYSTFSFYNFPPYEKEAKTMSISATYKSTPRFEKMLLFYYNNNEKPSNVAKELVTYWFNHYVLPSFKTFKSTPVPHDSPILAYPLVKEYSYAPINQALLYFGYQLTEAEYNAILYALCDNQVFHGLIAPRFPRIRGFRLTENYSFTIF